MIPGNMNSSVLLGLVTDTHFWPASAARSAFTQLTDSASERDGLLVARSPLIVSTLLGELVEFSANGGAAAIHVGDAGCGGGGFHQPPVEHASSLMALRTLEAAALPTGFLHHIPGNHDLAPTPTGGLDAWQHALGPQPPGAAFLAGAPTRLAYRKLHLDGHPASASWRVLLLDSTDGVATDADGHGAIGAAQLAWLEESLQAAERQRLSVVLCMHQLLVDPSSAAEMDDEERRRRRGKGSIGSGVGGSAWLHPVANSAPSWIAEGDMVKNRAEVLRVLGRYSRVVRLSLHGHVHANTVTRWRGIPFVTLSSTTEWPLQWHSLQLEACGAFTLQQHDLNLADAVREESRARDTRPGRNRIKLGSAARQIHTASSRSNSSLGGGEVRSMVEHEHDVVSRLSAADVATASGSATTLEVNTCTF